MKRILVPTDLSEIAERGLKLAVEIAKHAGAEIYLINFTRHPFGKTFSAMGDLNTKFDEEEQIFNIELLQSNRSKLNQLGSYYAQEEGVTINTEIVDDELKDGVDFYLRQHGIDLVVMGTSGEETLEEQFTGNHTEQIIRISSCPVISMRDDFDASGFQNIVLVMDTIRDIDVYPGIQVLRELADDFDANVHLVHICSSLREVPELETYFISLAQHFLFKRFQVRVLVGKDETETVKAYAETVNADMVAVLKTSREGLFRMFSRRLPNRMVKEVGRPVFTYNLQNV